jgi:hypothetical protein
VRSDRIRQGRVAAARLLVFCAVTLTVIAAAPVVVIAGEPLRRYYLQRLSRPPLRMRSAGVLSRFGLQRGVLSRTARRQGPVTGQAHAGLADAWLPHRSSARWRGRSLAGVILANPVLIALTAPERWAIDQVGGLRSGGRGFGRSGRRGGDWPPPAGVREPRGPKPNAPAGALALAEPRQQLRVIPILKAFPPALSKPASRVGSLVGRMAGVPRLLVSRLHLGR